MSDVVEIDIADAPVGALVAVVHGYQGNEPLPDLCLRIPEGVTDPAAIVALLDEVFESSCVGGVFRIDSEDQSTLLYRLVLGTWHCVGA